MLDDKVHLLLGGREDWAATSSNKLSSSYWAALVSHQTNYNTAFSPKIGLLYQPFPWSVRFRRLVALVRLEQHAHSLHTSAAAKGRPEGSGRDV